MNQLAINTIANLQNVLEQVVGITSEIDQYTDHFFAPGIYLRTLFIPKGHIIVGAIHKDKTLNILLKGKISVITSDGDHIVAKAPYIFTAEAGQKAGYAVENVWYASIFPNIDNVTNIKKLEQEHTVPTYNALEVLS